MKRNRRNAVNNDESDNWINWEDLEDSGEEMDSVTCDSVSLTVGESHPSTSRSNTPPNKQGSRSGKSGSKSRKRVKIKRWTVPKKQQGKPVTKSKYVYSCQAKEDHGSPVYGCQFYQNSRPGQPIIFATVGINRAVIYECPEDGSIKLLYCFEDPDPKEYFYTCAWNDDEEGRPLLAAAGHTQAINDLVFHPKDKNILLSASKDYALRLWNIKTDVCVAIFGGVEGHRDEVLAVDIDLMGLRMVSSGMDHSIKVWSLKKPEVIRAVLQSYIFKPTSKKPFPTLYQHFPDFSTRDIHRNYVDCAKWFGEFIFSKSCENKIVCWKAGKTFQEWDEITHTCSKTSIITTLDVKNCPIWFMKFAINAQTKTLALGNKSGKIFIYDLNVTDPSEIRSSVLSHPKCAEAIRQTAFSRDGSIIICVCEDASIWRWDINKDADEDSDD